MEKSARLRPPVRPGPRCNRFDLAANTSASGAPEEEEGRFLQWGREENNNEAAWVLDTGGCPKYNQAAML